MTDLTWRRARSTFRTVAHTLSVLDPPPMDYPVEYGANELLTGEDIKLFHIPRKFIAANRTPKLIDNYLKQHSTRLRREFDAYKE